MASKTTENQGLISPEYKVWTAKGGAGGGGLYASVGVLLVTGCGVHVAGGAAMPCDVRVVSPACAGVRGVGRCLATWSLWPRGRPCVEAVPACVQVRYLGVGWCCDDAYC